MKQTVGHVATALPTAVFPVRPETQFTTLGLVTHNRPDSLHRAVQSYVQAIEQHGRAMRVMVLDDSDSEAMQEANRAGLQQVAQNTAVSCEIHYAGLAQRRAFVQALLAQQVAPPEIIRFGLDESRHLPNIRRTGINRNALMLASLGDVLFSADDDTVYWPARLAASDHGLTLAVNEDPAEKYFFATEEEAQQATPAVDELDLWREHEAVLGHAGTELLGLAGVTSDEMEALPDGLARLRDRLRAPTSRVVATMNGLVGDCGLAFPFGLTGTAVGCLLQTDTPSHHDLVRDEEHYRLATTTRHTLRLPRRLALSDGSYLMTTFFGLDNRVLLPPFLPLFRAQDIIWGQTIWRTDATALLAHLPLALLHSPQDERRFWPGEIIRSASGYDTTRLVLDCLMAFEPVGLNKDAREGLTALGRHLADLGAQALPDFAMYVQAEATRRNEAFLSQMEAVLSQHNHQPDYWAADMKRYMHTMRQAMQAEDYIVPVDLRVHYRPRRALEMGQELLRLFGQLLQAWPDIVAASHTLRQADRAMTRPLRSRFVPS